MVVIRWYQSRLVSIVNEWQRVTISALENGVVGSLVDQFRNDDALDDFNQISVDLQQDFNATMPAVSQYADDAYGRTDAIHKARWKKVVNATYGVDLFLIEDWQSGFIRAFVDNNVALVKNLSEDTVNKITQSVIGGARSGIRPSEIAKNIRNDFKTTKKRAKLIARDQVSKLYGEINRNRQEDIGVVRYEWLDSDDERVRKSHDLNDKKVMQWKNSNVYLSGGKWVTREGFKGIPGEDIQCRCVALPVMPNELDYR